MTEKRKYQQSRRAETTEDTRRRIVEATVELHRTVGPAGTRIAEVARRAGVQRVTVYNHFPDESTLLGACSAHWRSLHPAPDRSAWLRVEGPGERLRHGLRELYAWYRETEPMTANVLRDVEMIPALRPIIDRGLGRYLEEVRGTLADAFLVRAADHQRVEAASRVAVGFHVWQLLAPLGDAAAADLAAGLVELAAGE